jgi:hypothetical protein
MALRRAADGVALALAALVTLLVLAAVITSHVASPSKASQLAQRAVADLRGGSASAEAPPLPARNWTVIGAGLSAAAFVHALPAGSRATVVVREADARVGGRALSVPQPAVPVSTQSSPREFAAWVFEPLQHARTTALLRSVGVPTLSVQLRTPATVLWTPERGAAPFETLALPRAPIAATMTFAQLVAASRQSKDVWFAHTGMWVDDCPTAAADVIARLDLPIFAYAPSGFGWQDVVLRALGDVPIVYDRVLERIDVGEGAGVAGGAALTFASGDVERVDGAVLTLPPPALARVQGLTRQVRDALGRAFVHVPVGVLYATWATADVWWPRGTGCIATTLPLGRMFVVTSNDVRCAMSGVRDVDFWTQALLASDPDAVRKELAAQLSRVAGKAVPPPAAVAFRAWPQAVSFWVASVDRAATRALLARPCGPRAPVLWASSDVSDTPGWVEGALQAGADAARAVQA